MLSSRIQNYRRMQDRRASFTIGVTYDTPSVKLKRVPEMIRQAIESHEHTRFDRSHFKAFEPSSLDCETVYYMDVPSQRDTIAVQSASRRYADGVGAGSLLFLAGLPLVLVRSSPAWRVWRALHSIVVRRHTTEDLLSEKPTLLDELNRRNVIRTAGICAVVAGSIWGG